MKRRGARRAEEKPRGTDLRLRGERTAYSLPAGSTPRPQVIYRMLLRTIRCRAVVLVVLASRRAHGSRAVSYTHLRAHETLMNL
eukprot:6697700-Prymnesium_polylepis.1